MNQRNGWDSAPAAIHGTALWRNRSESLPEKAESRNAPRDFPPWGSVLPSCRKFPWTRKSAFLRESENWIGCWVAEWCPVLWCLWEEIRVSVNPPFCCRCAGFLRNRGKRFSIFPGEESLQQIKMRAQRIGEFRDTLQLLCETNLGEIEGAITREKPEIVIIDSIQTMYQEEVSAAPGSVSQVRESTGVFLKLAKGYGISIFIVGHVTKEGTVAGPRVLEHMVDTVLYFEGDRHASYRILRGVKNRFGSTNEIGVFEMRQEGLCEVKNPSEFMLNGKPEGASGSVVSCSMEGTRPILVEIQALVCQSNFGFPRRQAAGTDFNRVNLLMAVLEKRLGLQISGCDAYVNIAGGMKVQEPAIDLGIVMAVISSFKNRPIEEHMIAFGEVGLSGEVRAVSQAAIRVSEAKKLGFETCVLPKVCLDKLPKTEGIRLIGVQSVKDVMDII